MKNTSALYLVSGLFIGFLSRTNAVETAWGLCVVPAAIALAIACVIDNS